MDRVARAFTQPSVLCLEPAVVSPLGLVPKHEGGWRRIHDLPLRALPGPEDNSTNDGIRSRL